MKFGRPELTFAKPGMTFGRPEMTFGKPETISESQKRPFLIENAIFTPSGMFAGQKETDYAATTCLGVFDAVGLAVAFWPQGK